MVFLNCYTDTNVLLFTYMFIYNLSLLSLFWILFSIVNTKFKTLQSFNGFSFNSFSLTALTILLFSMAGVPPFVGFFSKLFIMTLIVNNSFFTFYFLFFVVLFFGLYFYVQNIRFLHSTNHADLSYTSYLGYERVVPTFYYFVIFVLTLLIFGTFYIDDLLLIMTWLFN